MLVCFAVLSRLTETALDIVRVVFAQIGDVETVGASRSADTLASTVCWMNISVAFIAEGAFNDEEKSK